MRSAKAKYPPCQHPRVFRNRPKRTGIIRLAATLLLFAVLQAIAKGAEPDQATATANVSPTGGKIVVEATGLPPDPPLFFSASAQEFIKLNPDAITTEATVTVRVLQGKPEVLSLGLSGPGEIIEVKGEELDYWAVRHENGTAPGRRLLDLRPRWNPSRTLPWDLKVTVRGRLEKPQIPGTYQLLTITPGVAIGFSSLITLQPGTQLDARLVETTGLSPVLAQANPAADRWFSSVGENTLRAVLSRRGAALQDAELVGAQLNGKLDAAAHCVQFRLKAEARARVANTRLRLLSGSAALSDTAAGDGWHIELTEDANSGTAYDLVIEKPGNFPLDIGVIAAIAEDGDWQTLNFDIPGGTVVPIRIEGLPDPVSFDNERSVVPAKTDQAWTGFLPANGGLSLAWKQMRDAEEGALFFTSHENSDVRVGAGLIQQTSSLTFKILQGKLPAVKIRLDGPGEVIGVEGGNVVGWKVVPEGDQRRLDITFSRPLEKEATLTIRSQIATGGFPVQSDTLRLTPDGTLRHSGYVRIANRGAVRLEVLDTSGMMQLAPGQYPGGPAEKEARQVFVYRFPSANYHYRIVANQIAPEIALSEIVIYELAETDRVITADLELDIREAPMREWSLSVPADYAVVSVTGTGVADYVAETNVTNGMRLLKILFNDAVFGRQLTHLRLEKNLPAAAGEWKLEPLLFPGTKSTRGHIGIVSAAGFRIVPANINRLVETPLSYFPKQVGGLQQAFRLREETWEATMKIEALGQSVEADVFHLYSLKQGFLYGSVLINYFVVGAPANEWRVEVPESAGNVNFVGQNVRKDRRKEGNTIIVPLQQPVLGAGTLLVTFEQAISDRGATLKPGEIRPVNVQGERGFIQVVSPLQVKHTVKKAEGALLKLEPLELPAEYRLLSTSPTLVAYQYTSRPFELELNVESYAPAQTVDQVVDFAKLNSQISRDGQVRTEAHYFIKTRGRKALRFVLPEGVKLWEAKAGGELVNARSDKDETIIPLPPRSNPNEPVEVILQLGQTSRKASQPVLQTPELSSPTVISEWTLTADPEYLLVPRGGTAELTVPVLTETGFEWIWNRAPRLTPVLLFGLLFAALLRKMGGDGKRLLATTMAVVVFLASLAMAVNAVATRRVNEKQITYAATVVPANESATIQVGNMEAWKAMISWWGVAAVIGGVGVAGAAGFFRWIGGKHSPWLVPASVLLIAVGLLLQRSGAALFFLALALLAFLFVLFGKPRRMPNRRETTQAGAATALFLALALLLPPGVSRAEEGAPAKPLESVNQTWTIRKERLFAEGTLSIRAGEGESFLLLKAPAVLTEFTGTGLRLGKVTDPDGAVCYYVSPEKAGQYTATFKFEMPVAELGQAIPFPVGSAAVQRVTIDLDQSGWEFSSSAAVGVFPMEGLEGNRSGARLVLAPAEDIQIELKPKQRDVTAESTQYYAETANLYIPGPGVVNGRIRVTVRPAQGQVSNLELLIPKGFTVGEVGNGPVGEWRFDPVSSKLKVALDPAQSAEFKLDAEIQSGAEGLPMHLTLEPVRVMGAAGDVGALGIAFAGDAQPESIRPTGLSQINLEDFNAALIPRGKSGEVLAVLQQAYRYGAEGGQLQLDVAPVAPEVRVNTKQTFSIGDDRLVVAVDLDVSITRSGLFQLTFDLPEGLEVESLTGSALSHWTESDAGGKHAVILHLNGRTMGQQKFALSLVGAAPRAQEAWVVPRVSVREATRQTGEIRLVPEKGIRIRAVGREFVSQLDAKASGETRPDVLAFRVLQANWVLKLGIEALDAYVTGSALQDVTVREGQTLTRINLRYRVDNAAIKQTRIRLPGLSETQVQTVRGSGSAFSDLVKVAGQTDVWEIRFQRGIAGETDVQIEFQGQSARDQNKELVQTPILEGVRQSTLFVAIRAGGRLDVDANEPPRGWQRVDWGMVPVNLQAPSDRSVPTLCFRVSEPEGPLAINVRRHEVADALKLRATRGELITIFSTRGSSLTTMNLQIEVVEKSALRVKLPKGAELFSAFVNETSVEVVRDGDSYLFNVSPTTNTEHSATVRLVYSVTGMNRNDIQLAAPGLSVPLENVSWRVIVPPGFEMTRYTGGLRLKAQRWAGLFGLKDYMSLSSYTRDVEAKKATKMIEEANTLLRKGEQQQAGEILSRAASYNALDEATNEDARVQLRNLKTQQALMGVNTRRQKSYLDNKSNDGRRNEQLEQAASANPFLQGKTNFDPLQIDQLLMGNSAEENGALKGIATCIVDQQLAVEPAPGAIDVTLPERGKVLTFERSVQVNGETPLVLNLTVRPMNSANGWYVFGLLLLTVVAGVLLLGRRTGIDDRK